MRLNRQSWRKLLNVLIIALTACYPFLVWLSLDRLQPRLLALMLAGVLLLRIASQSRRPNRSEWLTALTSIALLVAIAILNETRGLLIYPVFVSLLFFAVFSYSLRFPPTVVERLARLEFPDLPPHGVAYTRKVTQVWSVFFLCNAAISLITIWHGDYWLWSLYNGGIFYLLMGLLMAAERLVRRRVKASFAPSEPAKPPHPPAG